MENQEINNFAKPATGCLLLIIGICIIGIGAFIFVALFS